MTAFTAEPHEHLGLKTYFLLLYANCAGYKLHLHADCIPVRKDNSHKGGDIGKQGTIRTLFAARPPYRLQSAARVRFLPHTICMQY